MKNTDIAMIILIATISVVVSYFLGNALLGDPNDKVESISYIETIDDTIIEPDAEVFNDKAINPTVEVYIGNCGPLMTWNPDKLVCEYLDERSTEKEDEDDTDDADTEDETKKSTDEDE